MMLDTSMSDTIAEHLGRCVGTPFLAAGRHLDSHYELFAWHAQAKTLMAPEMAQAARHDRRQRLEGEPEPEPEPEPLHGPAPSD